MAKKPSAPELALTDQERTEILTRVVAEKTSSTKGAVTVLRREPHTAWLQYGEDGPGLVARMGSSVVMLVVHIALICISLGLWLLVLLLPGHPNFYAEVIQVSQSGQVSTEQVTEHRKVKRLIAEVSSASSSGN